MQPNTVNAHHDTRPPVPPELLETLARALATALIPPPRAPVPIEVEDTADFLTAAQLAQRLGVSGRPYDGWRSLGHCPTPWYAAAPARPPAGTPGGSPTSSRPAAWR